MTNVAVLGMDCYDDVLEVTKKLYTDTNMETGETIRIVQEYDGETFKLEEGHNSLNAFGLLVQNGFPTSPLFSLTAQQELEKLRAEGDLWISSDETIPWTDSKIASYNAAQKLFRCNECECVGFLSRVAEHWLGTHANLRVFQCPQCPYASAWARCVRMHLARQHNICPDPNQESLTLWKENPVLEEVTKYLERLQNLVEGELVDHVKEEPEEEDEEEVHQNAIATQTSTPPPDSPEEQPLTPDSQLEQDDLNDQEMHQQELQEQELHEQELHQQELHEQELHQQDLEQELHQQELQQELDEQEIHQQELEQHELQQHELQEHDMQQHELQQHELQQHELQQHELQRHELQQHELQQHELQQHELQQHELQEQELDEQELQQQQLEQELQQHEIHQQGLHQELSEQVLQSRQVQGGQITHVIEEHIQVPEEIAKQLQQLAAAHGGDIHPQLQIVITQQENQDLPPTIQIQIAQPQDLSNHLVSTSQQTIPLEEALSQSLASTITQQVLSQAQAVTQQIIVQQPQLIQTTLTRQVSSPQPAPTSTSRSRQQQSDSSTSTGPKRYNCSVCSYATDRRDLYTRHENIHRDEKPFHCYNCRKQFNRADHVKKHFLRMHRDSPYDINRIRRTVSKDTSTSTIQFFPKSHSRPPPPVQQVETTTVENISIPGLTAQKLVLEEKKNPRRKLLEKRHTCPYCTWTGVDNWCLKRHLNTHLKPFVCTMCEYKAARAERLGTHVFKVHNKKACPKCSFLADDQAQLNLHIQQTHNK